MKPQALRPGDTIGIVAPSWCGPGRFPHRVERGKAFLESLGYRVVTGQHCYGVRDHLSGTAEERVADIHGFFADPSVKAIFAAIGGNHSCHLLPLLDFGLIARNPKIFMGFSDNTVLNLAMYTRTGLVTFNGPAVMHDLAEYPEPWAYTVEHMRRLLEQPSPPGAIIPSAEWTEEILSWAGGADLSRTRIRQPSPGWTWLKEGRAAGPLVGGCLESLEHLRGTPYWPDWDGALLFFETSENAPAPAWVDAVLQDYANMGVLGHISGLLVGRPMGYTPEQREELRQVLLERTRPYGFPIVADMDFGHTTPQFTLPIGVRAELDTAERRFAIVEGAVHH